MVSITLYMVAAADRAIVTDSTKGIERPRNWDPCRMLKNTWGEIAALEYCKSGK